MTFESLQPILSPQPNRSPEHPLVLAGPCSAESRQLVLDTARQLAEAGIDVFRAGVWKPRTKPGGFEGIGAPALTWLAEVKNITGLPVATEVANRTHVLQALDAGIDILWIGARTSANSFAVQEIADTLAEKASDVAVLVKNPVNPDLELWIGALERIYNAGIRRLGAVHRGFSFYGKSVYRNRPLWSIPIELRRRIPNLPVIVDPSHMGGRPELIAPLSQQALDMRFQGLMIESHCNPDVALSDSQQQITPGALAVLLQSLVVRSANTDDQQLRQLRSEIDLLDAELIDIFARRMDIARKIGSFKKSHDMPVVQEQRYDELIRNRVADAVRQGMSPEFMRAVLQAVHAESVRQQIDILRQP